MKPLDLIVSEPQDFLFYLGKVSVNEVSICLYDLPNKTSPGDAIICSIVIKFSNSCIAQAITELMNLSLHRAYFLSTYQKQKFWRCLKLGRKLIKIFIARYLF